MWGNEKLNYSKRKTLTNLWEWYNIILKNNVTALWVKEGIFKKWDHVIIKKYTLENDKPHHVILSVKRNWKEIQDIDMSGWVFLNNFISHIDKKDIILKTKEKNKDKVNWILD